MSDGLDNDGGKIRITLDDLDRVNVSAPPEAPAGPHRTYGNVAASAVPEPAESGAGSILMRGWCYLGLAGLAGAVAAWVVCEPRFIDGAGSSWANVIIFPLMLILMCVGFGIAESVVEHSPRKAVMRALLSLGVGSLLGFVFYAIANIIFSVGLEILSAYGALAIRNPGLWITRSVAWMGFGVAGGVVYGLIGQSGKRCVYGIAGGVLGAGIGGFIFDPISLATGGAAASRGIGMAMFGAATGISIGLVESALKDRWLYVGAGPLAGKQFILYKPLTVIGSDQSSDIYLFKDPSILPQHASVELRGSRTILRASGPVLVQGRPVRETILESGSVIQIGRYGFSYRDRERVAR